MSTSAIITMVLIQGTITIITARIYYLVMNPPEKKDQDQNDQKNND